MNKKLSLALKNWRNLNDWLPSLEEHEIKEMLDHELLNNHRATFIERLHQRYNTMRVSRERSELKL